MEQIERKLVEAAIVEAAKVGFHAYQVNDGGDNVAAQTVTEVVAVVGAMDQASIFFKHEDGRRAWLVVVPGNGNDCLANRSVTPGFSEAMDKVCFAE